MFIRLSGKTTAVLIGIALLLFVVLVAVGMPHLGFIVVSAGAIPMVLYVMSVLREIAEEEAIDTATGDMPLHPQDNGFYEYYPNDTVNGYDNSPKK